MIISEMEKQKVDQDEEIRSASRGRKFAVVSKVAREDLIEEVTLE